jgi:hypothetical protein
MFVITRLPWLSLMLLLLAYTTFGKFVFTNERTLLIVIVTALVGLGVAIIMMNPLKGVRRMLIRWFDSDTVAFTVLVGLAAFASILLNWFQIFLPVIMILAAESLARIDIQTAEFTPLQACGILTAIAWLGLGLGWYMTQIL